jgi:membrane-associated PAP2 superfamily phosphatase
LISKKLKPNFIVAYLFLPLLVFFISLYLIALFLLDFQIADYLYRLQGEMWVLKEYWLTEDLIHKGGRTFSMLLALLLLLMIGSSYVFTKIKPFQKGLWYVFTVAITSTLVVNLLKTITHRDCPWDLIRYGGFKPYIEFFSPYPDELIYGQCFPAGHASAGYCWFGLYFFIRQYFYCYRNYALAFPILLGLLFGIDQQLRGAHFLSHDIWTALISWSLAVILYWLFYFERQINTVPLKKTSNFK